MKEKKGLLFKGAIFLLSIGLLLTSCQTSPSGTSEPNEGTPDSAVVEKDTDEGTTHDKSADTSSSPTRILVGSGLCGIPLHIAKQLEFFEAEGLVEGVDYEIVTSSSTGTELLSTNQVDVTFGLVAAMLAPLDNGLEAKTVLGIHTGCIQILAGAETGITSLEGLRGARIGVSQLASSSHIVAQRALADAGVGTTAENMEVEFVVYASDDLPLALENGAVDAIAIGDPQATILQNEGIGVGLFDSATSHLLVDEICCSLWVRNGALEESPEQVTKVVAAIQKASAWVDQNTDLAAQIQLDNEWIVGDLDIDRQVLQTYKYLPSVSGIEEALTRNILEMQDLGLIRAETDADALAESGFFRLEGLPDTIDGVVEAPVDPETQIK